VKETINALDETKSVADEYARKQHEEIVRALTEATKGRVGGEDGAAAQLRQSHHTAIRA
jgi:hypothetical protein